MSVETKQNPLVYLFKKTWRYAEGNRRNVVWFRIMFIVANAMVLFVEPLIWAKIINVITLEGITNESIWTLFGLLILTLVLEFVFWSLHGPARIMERNTAFKIRAQYRTYLLKGVVNMPMQWHVDHHSGDTIDRIEKGTGALFSFSENSFEIIRSVVQLVGSYIMLIYCSPTSAYIVLGMTVITAWIIMRFDKVLVGNYQQLNRAENNVSESVFDAISNITTVIILRVERLVFRAILKKIEKPYELFNRTSYLTEIKWFLTSLGTTVVTIVVLGVYFWQHLGTEKGILVGSVYLLINYLGKINELFFKFASMYGEILQRKAKVMNAEELTKDFRLENAVNHVLPVDWRQLEIEHLNFSYHNEEGSDLHLNDVSLTIARGERTALIGETGSGKTTFLKVMRDLYHPKQLQLSVDGKVISHGFDGISQAMALVPQNPEIFATTIIDNITLGAEYDDGLVNTYAEMACFADVAEKLPQQFETSIKEKGVNLSGGQQQRLALTRGLLACHHKDIVLLDEPTSSLDTGTEMSVYQNIFRGLADKTIISTIHRLHLLPLFDKIYFFDSGRIIAAGTLNDLLRTSPEFQELWKRGVVANDERVGVYE